MKPKFNGLMAVLLFSVFFWLSAPEPVYAQNVRSMTASGAITAGLRVKVSTTSVATAGVADEDIGVALTDAADGAKVGVIIAADLETITMTASGAITAGADVYPAASGKVAATVSGKRIGKALSATTTDGDTLTVIRMAPNVDRAVITYRAGASAVDDWVFVADRAYTVLSIKEVHSVAGSDMAAVTVDLRKINNVSAPGAAAGANVKEFLATAFDLKSTANTTVTGTLTSTSADLDLATGDKIGTNYTGTLTALAGCVIVIELKAK